MMKLLLSLALLVAAAVPAFAQEEIQELNPFDPNIEQILEDYDAKYFDETGLLPFDGIYIAPLASKCFRSSCKVWIQIVKSTQLAYLYLDGQHVDTWKVSTGAPGHGTPNFDKNPNGRIYDTYSSKKFPGGDYMGLGNMPYAVFIEGGFAIHGTPKGNWSKLGTRASHGCIRVLPENGRTFNRLVREHGIYRTWITVQD